MTSSIAGQQLADDRSDAYSKAPGSDITTVLKEHSNSGTSTEGSEGTIQTLYEDPPKCQCCINWVEQHPEDVRMEVEQQEQTKQKALVVRMCKNHREGKALVLDSVLVQSESLKETLAQVFEGYQGITPDLKKLVFRAPFHSFYYRWENFTQILDDQKMNDPEAASYTQLLYDVLDTELRGARNDVADLLGNGVITYELLWSLFEPGERVISKIGSHSQFFVTQRSHTKEKGSFELEGKFVDWDGSKFGYSSAMLQVRPFAGTKPITQLEVFPARLCPTLENIESEAIARGKKFCDLRSFHHIAYSKTVTYRGPWGNGAYLEPAAKEHIWRYFVTQTKADAALTDESYSQLAQLPWNNRQVKNVVKISMLLAAQKEEELSIDYIDTVLQATMDMETEEY